MDKPPHVAGRAADRLSDGLVEVSRVGGQGAAESLPDDRRHGRRMVT